MCRARVLVGTDLVARVLDALAQQRGVVYIVTDP